MVEQELEIQINGDFKNISPKPNLNKGVKGLDIGNHIVVEKVYAEGFEMKPKAAGWKPYYSVKVVYKGEEVTFLMSQIEHNKYKEIGGVGDKVKVTLTEEKITNPKTNIVSLIPRLTFEAVE